MTFAAMSKPQRSVQHGGALKLYRGATFGEVSNAPFQPQSPENQTIARTGTALAINYLTLGVAAHLPRNPGRGGARNRADRESHALTAAHIANLKAAERHAMAIGLPFTRMISIHWEAAGVPLAGITKAIGRFIDLLSKTLARHGSGTAWLWVQENGDGKGGHCHMFVHVPARLVPVLTGLQRGWVRRITGQPYRARVIHSRPIGGRLGLEVGNRDLHAVNLEIALAYVLKGASPEAASQFGLDRRERGGRVIGKRCGASQNIGAKARKAKAKARQ
ncbi:MAG: hypothetical protein WAT78_14680 [Rhizobiaceae bacterium]